MPTAVALVVVTAAIIGTLGYQSASSSSPSFPDLRSPTVHRAVSPAVPWSPSIGDVPRGDRRAPPTEADGALPEGVTVFDDEYPGIANLNPELLRALREAAKAAADDGIEFDVNSGWRSPQYQDHLLREAVAVYGSEKEAARWVATADTSSHVSGDAVDIGSSEATTWLSDRGATYGLCQIYRNEPWHYEWRSEAIDRGCPPMYTDPAHDPSAGER